MQRVTVNPKNGRSEHVFVDLEALYPNPNIPGTELCFEELMAGHRGWLDKVWKPETAERSSKRLESDDKTDESIDTLSSEVYEKLAVFSDPAEVDENGATKEHSRDGKARKMKIKEVNETQISE